MEKNDWRSTLAPGDEVFWRDPDRGYSSGIYTIDSIVGGRVTTDSTVLVLKGEGGGVAEVFASELHTAPPEGLLPVYSRELGYIGQAACRDEAIEVGNETPDLLERVVDARIEHNIEFAFGNVNKAWITESVPTEVMQARVRLTLDVAYDLNGVNIERMCRRLENMVEIAVGDGMLTGETDATVDEYSMEVKVIDEANIENYAGHIKFELNEQVDLEFTAPKGASKEQKDSAFLDALAQVASVGYLAVGETKQGGVSWFEAKAIKFCERLDIRLVEAQEPEIAGRWDWIDCKGNASDASCATQGEAAVAAIKAIYPEADWQYEVANDDTVLGYYEWVEHKVDADAIGAERSGTDSAPPKAR